MSRTINFYAAYFVLLACILTTSVVLGDGEAQSLVTKDAFSFTVPNPLGDTPLFETNDQNGRYFGLHIPMIYDGVLHFRGSLLSTKLTADWFHGLLSFSYDKTPQVDGTLHGPVELKMMWLKVYDNNEGPLV